MASVNKKPNSRFWMGKFRDHAGRIVMRSTKKEKRSDALEIVLAWERSARQARDGELTQSAILKTLGEMMEKTTGEKIHVFSVQQFFDDWEASRLTQRRSDGTLRRYKPILKGFLASLGERRRTASIGSVTTTEIERFRAKEIEDGKAISTVNTEIAVLMAVFSAARRQGLMTTNPAEAVEKMNADSEEKHPFTEDQFKALLAVAPNQDWKGMMILGWNTGIRIVDAANITWNMIDLSERSLSFCDRKSHARKRTQDKRTTVGLHKDIVQFLESLPGSDDPNSPLFPSLHGMRAGSHGGLSNAFRRIMKVAKIKQPETQDKKGKGRKFNALSFHSFRHSFVSRGADHNIPSDVRKKMVGHTSDAVHARYTKLALQTQLAYLDSLPSCS